MDVRIIKINMKENTITLHSCMSAAETAASVRSGVSSARQQVQDAKIRISASERQIGAWQHLDWDLATDQARAIDQAGRMDASEDAAGGVLVGVPVGIKDIIDTCDLPSENGTETDRGRMPAIDATVVARLRRAGAVILGKTITTECACGASRGTRNPHDLRRTPGGSSSGSAAAVAAGMVPLALGTQTAGSVIRPAAFCGVWAMMPSLGIIPCTGVLKLSETLDHVGVFANSPNDLALAIDAISGDDGSDPHAQGQAPTRLNAALTGQFAPPRLAFLRGPTWGDMEPDCAERYERLAAELGAEPRDMGKNFADIVDAHQTVMFAEIGHNMWSLMQRGGPMLSEMLRARLVKGRSIGADDYLHMLARIYAMRMAFAEVMADFDAAITAPTPGEAPLGLESTGSRLLTLAWTTLGVPAVNVPGMTGANGLPLGVQMVGRRGDDATVLRAAAWLGQSLADA
jgi:Asp-tRNA(Asn)/Glu-tRNA(Gln) amidotransferase A subunit family amidase